uniref:Uncharacterized protein n=1 Tax=Oryza sativa subsp. japonica TaxID=39947 RepID=Q8H315_ORYSJ|nr:hypothetical protein [Oryza sativa Japonica Group]BAC99795.1 hypothetical protein [Oryza sativa Japonica Group]
MASIHGKEGGNVASATEQREKARVVGDAEAKVCFARIPSSPYPLRRWRGWRQVAASGGSWRQAAGALLLLFPIRRRRGG